MSAARIALAEKAARNIANKINAKFEASPMTVSPEKIADVRPTEDITTRLDNLAQSLAGEYPPHTLMDLAEAASLITTLRSQLSGITEETSSGYALVPREPTDHMLNEGSIPYHLGDKWASMLAAAPSRGLSARAFIAAWRQKFPGAGFPALADVEEMLAAAALPGEHR